MPADAPAHVIGVDPDRDSVTASVVEASTTAEVAAAAFTASRGGYVQLLEWADRHTSTEQRTWAIEGAGGYGAGLASHLNDAGERVVEFGHPRSAATRDGAKTDALDARRAAREVLGQREPCIPRARVLDTTRPGAQRARVAAICELKALLVTAPVDLRDQLRGLTTAALVAKCSALRPPQSPDEELAATKQALRSIARRIKTLTEETDQLEAAIRPLISAAAPQLLDQPGVGPITAAQTYSTMLPPRRCVINHPKADTIPESSHLNRRGDRNLNRALHTIAITRSRHCPHTQAYIAKRISEGKTTREARRCLKRYIARQLYRLLQHPPTTT